MVSLQSDAMKFQRDFEAMRLSFTKEFSLPFVDFRRDVILDSELRSFLSLHGLVEKGLRKLLAFAVFYKGTTKNEVARTLLTAIVLRLEEFLEHLDLLEGLPVSVFGTMSGIAVHALSDLYDIQGELPAIASEIEFLADLWRF